MWLIAEYQSVTLFSFRSVVATSSGAKTLLTPTPFAVRTALLDAAIRTKGIAAGPAVFEWIKSLSIAVRPSEYVVITNLFTKILKPTRKVEAEGAMNRSIAFREYAHLGGTIALALDVAGERVEELLHLLAQVNYFGKRGSFFQLMSRPERSAELPPSFVPLDGVYTQDAKIRGKPPVPFVLGLIQMMDDWGDSLTFAKANIYAEERIVLGRDRVRKGVALPYRLVHSSKSFTLYERVEFDMGGS